MPRAGLITFHFNHHYGAQLQAYATMQAIKGLGWDCEIIDYRLASSAQANRLFKGGSSVRNLVSDAHTVLHYPAFHRRYERFDAFVQEEMTLSQKSYLTFEDLAAAPPPYDVYVAGSDQIWNPFIYPDKEFDRACMLDFVKEGRRISYAPSLGTPSLPPDKGDELKRFLEPFSALSVREKRGQALIRSLTDRDAQVVLDPTLLLTGKDWGALAAPPKRKGPYILCYFVSDPGEVAPYVEALAQKTGYPIVQLAGARRKLPGAAELIFDAGPREFLGLFQNAAYVCTNSFHGAAFSLQFDKPFFTSMSPKERSEPTYSRIYSLLSRLGCTDRIIGLDTTAAVDAPMDYEAVHRKLDLARADSLAYLKAALAGDPLPGESDPDAPGAKGPVLASHNSCTGCSACASVCPVKAITMTPDKEGFLRPVISEACILCRKCEGACPVGKPIPKEKPSTAWAVWNKDEAVRACSSSGGFFSVLASHVIGQGGAVFGAVYDDDFYGVHHACARTWAEVGPMRGSKYVQSDLGDSFRQIKELLDQGTPVLFSGLPCQVAGLYGYLGGDREGLITCDLVCHGVPSPSVFSHFIQRLEETCGARIKSLTFKDKRKGWSVPHLTAGLEGEAGEWSMPLNHTTYGRGFGMQLFLRPSCGQCEYTDPARPADFTLADFWGLDPQLQLNTDREKGISMVLVGSEKGRALFDKLSPSFDCLERPLEEAVKGNPRLGSPLKHNPKRAPFFAALAVSPYSQVEKQFLSLPPLPYRMAAKVLTPGMKEKIRKIIK